jgi:DNA-binding MarR family transcriptional regulator
MQDLAFRPKTRAQLAVERQHGIDLPAFLREQYHDHNRRLADIAGDLGLDTGTISRWMDQFGISRRIRTTRPAA